jgi:hypothetical protein
MGSKRPRTPDLTATPPRLSPFLHEFISPGRPGAGLWSNALPSVPEEEEATDRSGDQGSLDSVGAASASGITPESQLREPPAKKRRIECTGCKKGPFSANKSLYRHREHARTTAPSSTLRRSSIHVASVERSAADWTSCNAMSRALIRGNRGGDH